MGLHDGHRKRLIQRFLEEGLDSFEPHNVLELLLFFAIPRKDTNELAHKLIDTFGSLNACLMRLSKRWFRWTAWAKIPLRC